MFASVPYISHLFDGVLDLFTYLLTLGNFPQDLLDWSAGVLFIDRIRSNQLSTSPRIDMLGGWGARPPEMQARRGVNKLLFSLKLDPLTRTMNGS